MTVGLVRSLSTSSTIVLRPLPRPSYDTADTGDSERHLPTAAGSPSLGDLETWQFTSNYAAADSLES